MKVIGVTGSSGSGKSTVSKIIQKELNAKLIVADEIVKKMQEPGEEYFEKTIELLGSKYLNRDGKLNRRKVADLIFRDEEKREEINELTKKYIVTEIIRQIENSTSEYIVIDVPLLVESGLNKICNIVIGVISNFEEQIKRICFRDNIAKEEAIIRLNIQPNNDFYKKNVDYIVENNGGEYDKLLGRIRDILQEL